MGRPFEARSNAPASLSAFLEKYGWAKSARKPLPGDLSSRTYARLTREGAEPKTALLMTMPKPDELMPFLQMQRHLKEAHVRVPEIYGSLPENGAALIEDFGDTRFDTLIDKGKTEELIRLGVDVLLHLNKAAVPAGVKKYSPTVFLHQVCLFEETVAPGKKGFRESWGNALEVACAMPQTLLLRDYHAANIMLLEHEKGIMRAGLIDFQDGGAGPVGYDLVSFLEDARRDVPTKLRDEMIDYYLSKSGVKRNEFMRAYHILGAQRHLRVISVVTKKRKETGDNKLDAYLARSWRLLSLHEDELKLGALFAWLDAHVPARRVSKEKYHA